MALQGSTYIQALGGTKLVKPLMWVLRYAHPETKAAAMRAVHALTKDVTCCTFLSRVRQTFHVDCIPAFITAFCSLGRYKII